MNRRHHTGRSGKWSRPLAVERLENRDVPSTLSVVGPLSGTALSGLVSTVNNGREFISVGDTVYANATTSQTGAELFRVQGSSLALAADIVSGLGSSNPRNLVAAGDRAFFIATDSSGDALYMASTTTSTPAGANSSVTTTTVTRVPGSPADVAKIAAVGRDVFMITRSGVGVLRTAYDGNGNPSVQSITNVADPVTSGDVASELFDLKDIIPVDGKLVLTRSSSADDTSLIELFPGIDDSANATFTGRKISITGASGISNLTPVGARLYFHAATPTGNILTVMNPDATVVTLLPAGTTSGGALSAVDKFVYFAGTQNQRTELWRTDGTVLGTEFYLDINGQVSSSLDPAAGLLNSAVLDNTLFLAADFAQSSGRTQTFSNPIPSSIPDATGSNPIVNGSVTSPILVNQDFSINAIRVRVNITHPTVSNLRLDLNFLPTGQTNTQTVTLFDGQGFAGDNLVNTLFDDSAPVSITTGVAPFTGSFKPLNPLALFAGQNTRGNWTLTVTDKATGDTGTLNNWSLEVIPRAPQGVELGALKFDLAGNLVGKTVFELAPGTIGSDPLRQIPRSSNPANLTVSNGRLFFTADLPQGIAGSRNDLWTSDGTTAGTFMVSSPVANSSLSGPSQLTSVGNNLLFNATNASGSGIYNLSTSHTYTPGLLSTSIAPTANSLTSLNQNAYFISDGDFFTSDGTAAGTRATSSTQPAYAALDNTLLAFDDSLLFFKSDGVYKTDGTDAGTQLLPTAPCPSSVSLSSPKVVGRLNGRLQIVDGSNLLEYDGFANLRVVSANYVAPTSGQGPGGAGINGNLVYAKSGVGLVSRGLFDLAETTLLDTQEPVQNIIASAGGIVFLLGDPSAAGQSKVVFTRGSGVPITLYQSSLAETIPGSFVFSNGSLFFNTQAAGSVIPKVIKLGNPTLDPNLNPTGFSVLPVAASGMPATLTLANTQNGLQREGEAIPFSRGVILSLAGNLVNGQATVPTGNETFVISQDGALSLVANISPNPNVPSNNPDSDPGQFLAANGLVYFSADDGSGREIYYYDTQTRQAARLIDVNTNFGISSNPTDLTLSGNTFYWSAEPSAFSPRLYANLPDPILPPVSSIMRLAPVNEVITSTGTTPVATFMVRFNVPVDPVSVDVGDFLLSKSSSLSAGTILNVRQANAGTLDYTVLVDLGGANPGFGTLGLQVSASAKFSYAGNTISSFGGFQAGETYAVNPPKPTLVSLAPLAPSGTGTTNSANVSFRATFSTPVDPTTVNSNDFDVSATGNLVTGKPSVLPSGSGSTEFVITLPMVSGLGTASLALKASPTILSYENQPYDSGAAAPSSGGFSIDLVRPSLSQVNRFSPSNSELGQPTAVFAVKFSEAVAPSTVNATSTFRTSLGSILSVAQSSSDTWLVTVTGLPQSGTVALSMNPFAGVTDLYGNSIDTTIASSPNQTYTINPAPQLLSVAPATLPNPKATSVVFTATFSKAINAASVTASDFVLVTTGGVTGTIASATVSGSTVTVTVNGLRGAGTLTVNTAPGATILDNSGNNIVAPAVAPTLGTFLLDPPVSTIVNKPVLLSQASPGSSNLIEVRRGLFSSTLAPFPSSYRNGVAATTGDYNGDGVADVIAVARQGLSGRVSVFSGTNDQVIASFASFPGFAGPLNVASGDYNGDGVAEIAVGVAGRGAAIIKVFAFQNPFPIASLNALPGYNGGVSLAMADVTGDGKADIVTGTQGGTITRVRVFSQGVLVQDYRPIDMLSRSAILVSAGDLDGDGKAEVIVSGAAGANPSVTIFNGARPGQAIGSFFAFPVNNKSGVTVTVGDHDGDGRLDIYTALASGNSSLVKVFNGRNLRQVDSFFSLLSGPLRLS